MITNQEFNQNLEQFLELVLENLQLDDGKEVHIVNHHVKHLPFDKSYAFASLSFTAVRLDFTVSYHDYYQVPVINCRMYENGKFLPMAQSQSVLTPTTQTPVELQNHHLLDQPWLQIHHCETLLTIDAHLQNAPSAKRYNHVIEYLCCWFGLYGLPSLFPQFSFRPSIYY
ncbi:Ubiquitin-like-conjugating enzyme ATG10 [Candida viswanathii]|uniref:Ubiquitin-like-conjugating enzyme ATG10 n=1 Tax=Candida viswanathii TaxID=5486 RepID=A0A367XWJ5_9ASCO|nr:Ubiquitin-like-conjugating enzyme ATG10 [Candida viswanathii]